MSESYSEAASVEPNNPDLFKSVLLRVARLVTEHGVDSFAIHDDNPTSDRNVDAINDYPRNPTELYGITRKEGELVAVAGVPADDKVRLKSIGRQVTVFAPGPIGDNFKLDMWRLNPSMQKKTGRITEIVTTQLTANKNEDNYDPFIYWFQSDGTAWVRPYFMEDLRRVNDQRLEDLETMLGRATLL